MTKQTRVLDQAKHSVYFVFSIRISLKLPNSRFAEKIRKEKKSSTMVEFDPQGTVLGPLLFLLMIGDIDDNVKYSHLSSFADDKKATKGIS